MDDETLVQEEDSAPSEDIQEAIQSIKESYENGEDLTDNQLDLIADISIDIVRSILRFFDEHNCDIDEYEGDDGELILDINGGDLAVLIGRHGRVLDSVQSVVSSMLSKKLGFHYPVVVDIESYKNRRRQKIQSLAKSSAERAKKQGRVRMKPMSAYKRRLVHLALINDPDVTTHSEGTEPERFVVITAVK